MLNRLDRFMTRHWRVMRWVLTLAVLFFYAATMLAVLFLCWLFFF